MIISGLGEEEESRKVKGDQTKHLDSACISCLAGIYFLLWWLRTLQPLFSHNTTWSALLRSWYILGMYTLLLFSLLGNFTAKPSQQFPVIFLSLRFLSKYIIYYLVSKMHFTLFNLINLKSWKIFLQRAPGALANVSTGFSPIQSTPSKKCCLP